MTDSLTGVMEEVAGMCTDLVVDMLKRKPDKQGQIVRVLKMRHMLWDARLLADHDTFPDNQPGEPQVRRSVPYASE